MGKNRNFDMCTCAHLCFTPLCNLTMLTILLETLVIVVLKTKTKKTRKLISSRQLVCKQSATTLQAVVKLQDKPVNRDSLPSN